MFKFNRFNYVLIVVIALNSYKLKSSHKNRNVQSGSKTVIAYMSARNDLNVFASRNLSEMQSIGSNNLLKIVAQLDTYNKNKKNVTKRFFIERNKTIQIGPDLCLDSGEPNNLIDFFKWAVNKYPAEEYILILWNHGTGPLDPNIKKAINPSQLFTYNFKTKLIELNRSIGFLDYINNINETVKQTKGICFDDTSGNYLTNKKLAYVLQKISKDILEDKKITLCCDACLMSSIEVIHPLKNYVKYFIGSQEVVLGTGYNYSALLRPLSNSRFDINNFSNHVVNSFKETYSRITNDFTQSGVNTEYSQKMFENISKLSQALVWGIKNQKASKVREMIRISRHKYYCTHFDEPSYIDIGHFYKNIYTNLKSVELNSLSNTNQFKSQLTNIIKEVIDPNGILSKLIIANAAGKNLKNSTGLSIYFPERHIHSSYISSEFAIASGWLDFLKVYLNPYK